MLWSVIGLEQTIGLAYLDNLYMISNSAVVFCFMKVCLKKKNKIMSCLGNRFDQIISSELFDLCLNLKLKSGHVSNKNKQKTQTNKSPFKKWRLNKPFDTSLILFFCFNS